MEIKVIQHYFEKVPHKIIKENILKMVHFYLFDSLTQFKTF